MSNFKHLALIVGISAAVGLTVVSCAGRKEIETKGAPTQRDIETRAAEEAARLKAEAEAKAKVEAERAAAAEAQRKAEAEAGRKAEEAAAQRKAELAMQAIHFDYDKAIIRPDAQATLSTSAAILQKYPEVTVTIEGHCDERGTLEYNLALGDRRAKAARDYFVRYGIDGRRLATESYGEERPVDSGHTEEAWAKNRRDEFAASDPKTGKQ